MPYSLQDRLGHTNRRMSQVNNLCATYITGTTQIPVDVSPILISPDELTPGDSSITRVERQDFGLWKCSHGPNGERGLGSVYPPADGHKIRLADGSEYVVKAMGFDEPPYIHTTSNRERLIVHTVRTKA